MNRAKRRKREGDKMMKRELTMDQMELVNGAGVKEFFEFLLKGMIGDTQNDVPHGTDE